MTDDIFKPMPFAGDVAEIQRAIAAAYVDLTDEAVSPEQVVVVRDEHTPTWSATITGVSSERYAKEAVAQVQGRLLLKRPK